MSKLSFIDPAPILGFWSYAHDARQHAQPFKSAMELALRDRFALRGEVEIYFDHDPQRGMTQGSEWASSLVDSLARSMIFFWFQSPRWLNSGICRFELDVFKANMASLCDHLANIGLPSDRDHLTESLMCPIKYNTIDEASWRQIDPMLRRSYEPLFRMTQYSTPLDLTRYFDQHLIPAPHDVCRMASEHLYARVTQCVPALGQNLEPILTFLAADRPAFRQVWHSEFHARDLGRLRHEPAPKDTSLPGESLVDGQRRLAFALTSGRTSLTGGFDSRLVLAPVAEGDAFWLADEPLTSRQGEEIGLRPDAGRDAAGHALWSRQVAAEVRQALRLRGYDLPNAAQAKAIGAIFADRAGGESELRRLGLCGWPADFWVADADAVGESGRGAERLPLLFVKPVARP